MSAPHPDSMANLVAIRTLDKYENDYFPKRDRITIYAPDPRIQADPAWPSVDWQLSLTSRLTWFATAGLRDLRSYRTIALAPDFGDTHQAAVREPPAPPSERHSIAGPLTRICPSRDTPTGRPISLTSASRASSAEARGHG